MTPGLTKEAIADMACTLLEHEDAALAIIPTPERRGDLTRYVDATLLAFIRHRSDSEQYPAFVILELQHTMLELCHDHMLGSTRGPAYDTAVRKVEQSLVAFHACADDDERANIAAVRAARLEAQRHDKSA